MKHVDLNEYSFKVISMGSSLPKASMQGAVRRKWQVLFKDSNAPQRRFWEAPSGRGEKRPSALLCFLELATASPAVTRLAASRHAEPVNITLKEYWPQNNGSQIP